MPPFLLSALTSAAPEALRAIMGLIQRSQAKKMEGTLGDRPVYQIPNSINKYVDLAHTIAAGGLPGKDSISGDIDRSAANALQLGKEYGGSTDVDAIFANEQKQHRDLGVLDSQQRLNNISAYESALGTKAGYEDKEFDYNKVQPYNEKVAAIAGTKNAANTNIFEAVKNFATIGTDLMNPGLKEPQDPTAKPVAPNTNAGTGTIATPQPGPNIIPPQTQQLAQQMLAQGIAWDQIAKLLSLDVNNPNIIMQP